MADWHANCDMGYAKEAFMIKIKTIYEVPIGLIP
jgi:hypothetical protein